MKLEQKNEPQKRVAMMLSNANVKNNIIACGNFLNTGHCWKSPEMGWRRGPEEVFDNQFAWVVNNLCLPKAGGNSSVVSIRLRMKKRGRNGRGHRSQNKMPLPLPLFGTFVRQPP